MKLSRWIWLLLPLLITATGCKRDLCNDIECENGGRCETGACRCPEGYTGLRCEIEVDPCTIKNCVNVESCIVNAQRRAICICKDGYEGSVCDSSWNLKYTGRFGVSENCRTSVFFYVDISTGPRFNEITLANFHNKAGTGGTAKVVAEAITPGNLLIRQQFMHFGQVYGAGSFNPIDRDRFSLEYRVINTPDTLVCVANFERQR